MTTFYDYKQKLFHVGMKSGSLSGGIYDGTGLC